MGMFGKSTPKAPKASMLGTGGAAQAGSAMEIMRRIREIELRMTDSNYVPTAAEESELAQLRGRLQDAQKKK